VDWCGLERLQKILSQAGLASRRTTEQLMREGRVTVNGQTVTELGTKADPAVDDIRVDGRRVRAAERKRYLLLNKPRGYVSTRDDPQRRRTVIDLLEGVREYVYPVGRLDFDSEGLLILTNDGELTARLTHPRHGVERVYEARVRGVPDRHALERLAGGVVIDGRRTSPARARLIRTFDAPSGPQALVELTIREGRKRQVRLMCDAIGHPVVRLRRVRIGPISDTRLKTGHWRELTDREIAALKRAAGLDVAPSGPSLPRTATRSRPIRRR
jgi:23S rRNA pseudouridine2605 synthase